MAQNDVPSISSVSPSRGSGEPRRRVLAVASGGGHWVQLSRLFPALQGHDVACVSTLDGYRSVLARERPEWRYYKVFDASIGEKGRLLRLSAQVCKILLRERPDVVISTGAAPGFVALRLGKLFGAQTLWLDSAANYRKLSLSGRHLRRHADVWLTQWPHLAEPNGPRFYGRVF